MGLDMYLTDSNGNEVGYWRKANAIHGWFVDTVQNGVDDCGKYEVTYEQLVELSAKCTAAFENEDASILEPRSGFFFGNTEVDDWYWDSLEYTAKIIDDLDKNQTYYYQASW